MPLRHAVLAAVLVIPVAASAGPRDDLLRLVPDDYTFCVIVQDLRGHAKSDGHSTSFLKGVADSPLLKGLQSAPEATKFHETFQAILKELNVTPEQLRDDLLGDTVIFAYRKGPTGDAGREDGLVLLHARDDKLLRRVIDRINEIQTKAGEIKAVEPVGAGKTGYFRRAKMVEGEPADFYAVQGHRLAFSGNEALLRSVIPGLTTSTNGESRIGQRLKALGVNDSPVAILINPRSFDGDMAEGVRSAKGSEQAFLKQFSTYWRSVEGLALFANFRPAIEVGLSVNVRRTDLPAAAATFLAEAGKRSPLWDRIPEDPLFAAVGRIHLESLAATLGGFLIEPDRKKVLDAIADAARPFLETDDYATLARGLGPDVGFWVAAPEAGSKTWSPRAVLAAKIADGPDGRAAERAALRGLDFLARLACLQHKGLRVQSERQGEVDVQYLTFPTAFPPAFRPAFTSKGGYIVVTDSPETLARFDPPTGPAKEAVEVPLLRISASAWRSYLTTHRAPALEYLAGLKGMDPKELGRQIDVLVPLLEGLDQLEVVHRSAPGRAMFLVRLRDMRP